MDLDQICGRLNRILSTNAVGRIVNSGDWQVLYLSGSMTQYKFLCYEGALIHLVMATDTWSVIWIGETSPCPVCPRLENWKRLLNVTEKPVTSKEVKKVNSKTAEKLARQQSEIDILKQGGRVTEFANKLGKKKKK